MKEKLLDLLACPTCGDAGPHHLGAGSGSYVASLVCRCKARVRWLSKYQAKHYHPNQQVPRRAVHATAMALAFEVAMQRKKGVRP